MREFEYKITGGYDHSLEEVSAGPHDRTPHAGNLSKTSQALIPSADAKILAFSGNRGSDPTYEPTKIVTGENSSIEVVREGENFVKLTPYIHVDRNKAAEVAERFNLPIAREVESLAQLHIAGAQAVWGETKVEPFHFLLIQEVNSSGQEVIRTLAEIEGACDRRLNENGYLEPAPKTGKVDPDSLVATTRSIALSSMPGEKVELVPGPALSNPASVVAHSFVRALPALRNGSAAEVTIYHSSGPAMIDYSLKEDFANATSRLARELAKRLDVDHASINVVIFPGSELTISTPDSPETRDVFRKFSTLVDFMLAYQKEGEERNREILRVSRKHGLEIDPEGKIVTSARKTINSIAQELSEDMPKIRGLNFEPRQYTQWSMLENGGSEPVVPKAFRNLSVRQIVYFTDLAKKFKEGNTMFSKNMPGNLVPNNHEPNN